MPPDRNRRASKGDPASSQPGTPDKQLFPGHELLARGDVETVLRAISQGDPLHLLGRCAERLRQRAYLLDADRLYRQALSRVALASASYDGDRALEEWLRAQVDVAMRDLLGQDRRECEAGNEAVTEWDPRYEFATYALGIQPERAGRACVDFNGLDGATRRAFFELCLHGKSLQRCLAEGLGPLEVLRERTRTALAHLLGLDGTMEAPRGREG